MPVYSQGKRKKNSLTKLAPVCFQKKKKKEKKWKEKKNDPSALQNMNGMSVKNANISVYVETPH